jgi:CHRD domain-containing protein
MLHKQLLSITAILAAIISIGAVSLSVYSIQAQEGETFSANLSGKNEVPPSESNATGWVKFQTDDKQVFYLTNITGLNELTGIHLFIGSTGEDGDRVATLSGYEEGKGANNATISIKGNITKDNLEGSLNGKELTELVSLMSHGKINVDVDTGDEFYKGEIRGQVVSGLPQMESNMGSPTESNNTSSNEG